METKTENNKRTKNIVIVEKDTSKENVFHRKEVELLLDYYNPCNKFRIAFMIMATCGLRESEVSNIRRSNVFNYEYIKYIVKKPKIRARKTGTTIEYKTRTVKIEYKRLQEELKAYMKTSSFENDRLFPFHKDTLRKQFNIIREEFKKGKLPSEYSCFLEKTTDFIAGNKKYFKPKYRLSSHKLRHFYNTFRLWTIYQGNIILSKLDLAHESIDTNYIYTHKPESIGLTKEQIGKNLTFDNFILQNQTRLNEFF